MDVCFHLSWVGVELPSHCSNSLFTRLRYCWAVFQSDCAFIIEYPHFLYSKREKVSLNYFAIIQGWYVLTKKESNGNGLRVSLIYISMSVHFTTLQCAAMWKEILVNISILPLSLNFCLGQWVCRAMLYLSLPVWQLPTVCGSWDLDNVACSNWGTLEV